MIKGYKSPLGQLDNLRARDFQARHVTMDDGKVDGSEGAMVVEERVRIEMGWWRMNERERREELMGEAVQMKEG